VTVAIANPLVLGVRRMSEIEWGIIYCRECVSRLFASSVDSVTDHNSVKLYHETKSYRFGMA